MIVFTSLEIIAYNFLCFLYIKEQIIQYFNMEMPKL